MQDAKPQINYSADALADLQNIWQYTERVWSEEQADIYTDKLEAACKKIAQNPRLGRYYDNAPVGVLGYKAESHVIFYTVSPAGIDVLWIMHGRMDFKSRFRHRP